VVGRLAADPLLDLLQWIDGLGATGAVLFGAVYALAVVALVPGSILTVAAGAMFGVVIGTLVVFISASIGAAAAFLIGRHLVRDRFERRLSGDPRFGKLNAAIGGEGLKVVLLLRLTPVIPFSILNYALGLSRVSFSDYLFASIGMLPGTLLYVYSGRVIGEIALVAGGATPPESGWSFAILALGLVATGLLVALVTRIARKALSEETGIGDPSIRHDEWAGGTKRPR